MMGLYKVSSIWSSEASKSLIGFWAHAAEIVPNETKLRNLKDHYPETFVFRCYSDSYNLVKDEHGP